MRPHGAYVEPFAGSLAVLLAKEPTFVEVVNDQNELLITFYRVLRDKDLYAELEHAIRTTPYSRRELQVALTDDPTLPKVERVRRFFVRVNQAYVASNGTGTWTVTYQASAGHSNASKWTRFQERLYSVRRRLEGVQLECCDAFEILARLNKRDDRGVVYVDPPYLIRNGVKYVHELNTSVEHERLAEALSRVAATGRQVLVSGYACPEYDNWYRNWRSISFTSIKTGQTGKGSRQQEERLWISPPRRRVR
jgi:DNA adenine methylase